MDGFVIEFQSLGESFEGHSHINRQLLRVNAPTRLIVQLGQDDLKLSSAVKYGLQLLLDGRELILQFSDLLLEVRSVFDYCCCHA